VQDRLAPDDQFLLCTDGLTKVVSDQEIAETLAVTDCHQAPARLIALALERGAPDNVTVVVVECTAENS
jgi:serine/threonine-protein phosphatase Stp1